MMVKVTKSSGDIFKDLGVERPEKELKDKRVPMFMKASEIEAIERWQIKHRVWSRSEAIRRLVAMGLESDEVNHA